MNSRISLVYQLLLLTSIISSGVLFILVAAEHGINIGQLHQETKDSRQEESKKLEVENAVHDKPIDFDSSQFERLKDEERQLDQQIRSSFDEAPSEELKDQPLNAAESGSLFQNHASITDEFSESGHAVVLTLVDSASQELQQQAAVVTKLLEASADAANDTTVTSQQGPVTVPLPLESDAATVANETTGPAPAPDLYVVRAEPKQVDATSQPTPASSSSSSEQQQQQHPQQSLDVGGSQAKNGREGGAASDSLQGFQDNVVEDATTLSSEGQDKVSTMNEETAVANTTSSGGGGGGGGEVASSSSQEEIPSFSEWAQKQLAEAEKKKAENKTRGGGGGGGSVVKRITKQRSKNYASPDCGAKVVSTNPEASSVWAVLSTSRDEYLLNSCQNKIWFVVELCEAIQPEKIELANFELFSSILREFSVSVSDRHPTREWTQVGQFEAKEVRTVQSFGLKQTSAFVKYIRVEFHSHYGAEHYCPISLFRVYGTSEFEVLDTVDESHATAASLEEDDDEFEDEDAGARDGAEESVEKPRNLFSSARDAVLSIVKRAAQVLVKGEGEVGGEGSLEGQGNISSTAAVVASGELAGLVGCVTPAYIIVCDNCSDALYNSVHHELSCHSGDLEQVLASKFSGAAAARSDVCKARGLDLLRSAGGGAGGAPFPMLARTSAAVKRHQPSHYLETMLPDQTIIALCNLLAIARKQVVLNITYDLTKDFQEKTGETTLGEPVTGGHTDAPLMPLTSAASPSTCTLNSTAAASSASQDAGSGSATTGSKDAADSQTASSVQIKPTKTFLAEDMHSLPADAEVSTLNATSDGDGGNVVNATTVAESVPVVTASSQPLKAPTEDPTATVSESLGSEESMLDFADEAAAAAAGGGGLAFDSIFSELDEVESADPVAASASSATTTTQPTRLSPPQQQTQQRESVFLRLAKRIKALERNMSLSGQYLEELSRRYKRQVEEMQRSLNEVVEERRRHEEKEERRAQEVARLTDQMAKLTLTLESLIEERNSWAIKHGAVIVVEVVVFAVILLLCRWLPDASELGERSRRLVAWQRSRGATGEGAPRRSSVDGSSPLARPYPPNPRLRKRRPSEEALRISGSTHQDLLIPDASRKNSRAENRRRRRKKKEQQQQQQGATFYVDVDTSSSTSSRQMAPPPPPPPLPPPPPVVRPVVAAAASKERRSYIVPVAVVNGDADSSPTSLPPPPSILAPPHSSPPSYMRTALSIRKKRKESLRGGQSSSELSDSSTAAPAPSASSAKLTNLSSPSLLAKKSGPLKKIMKKLF